MSDQQQPKNETDQSPIYQIRLAGHLASHWAGAFAGLSMALTDNGETVLTGPVVDQAALYGLLRQIRDTGMTLISVTRLQSSDPDS